VNSIPDTCTSRNRIDRDLGPESRRAAPSFRSVLFLISQNNRRALGATPFFGCQPGSPEGERLLIVVPPLGPKFFVKPPTAIVTSPNLSAHKPAGNCAPGDNDGP
jgi:hypothetical protein